MHRFFHQGLAALAVAVVMAFTAAPPARAATPEANALGQEVASILFRAADMKSAITRAMREESASLDGLAVRPEWKEMLMDAMIEETMQDLPKLEALLGKLFADHFTIEELRAGAAIMRDPAFQAVFAAGVEGRDPPANLKLSKQSERLLRSPAGEGFLTKLGKIDTMMDELQTDFVAEVIPGAFRRFADKAEAAEAARAAAAGGGQ